eukprot:TRINITY_DN19340_c0_g1_i1.p2 TRINITY_DN19340_c0_g1~~TRINITY_DN19340_c0_g1_i1.p2  ORF type:complete len:213 (+),score=69.44 TRINITY_DN19340_c0_g1_i1:112-750(+)
MADDKKTGKLAPAAKPTPPRPAGPGVFHAAIVSPFMPIVNAKLGRLVFPVTNYNEAQLQNIAAAPGNVKAQVEGRAQLELNALNTQWTHWANQTETQHNAEYKMVVNKHNTLVDAYKVLADKHNSLVDEHNALLDKANTATQDALVAQERVAHLEAMLAEVQKNAANIQPLLNAITESCKLDQNVKKEKDEHGDDEDKTGLAQQLQATGLNA